MKGKLYCLLALLLVNVTAFAQSSLYVVSFTDKPNYHAENPIDFLSQRTTIVLTTIITQNSSKHKFKLYFIILPHQSTIYDMSTGSVN